MKKLPSLPQIDFKALADDFRNLNPQDVGTWPLAPRLATLVGLFILILAGGWWFLWNEQLETLTAREQEEVKLKDEFIAKKTQAANLDLYRQQLNEIDRSFGALLRQLPSKSEVDARELADWIVEDRLPVRFQMQLHKILWNDEPGR